LELFVFLENFGFLMFISLYCNVFFFIIIITPSIFFSSPLLDYLSVELFIFVFFSFVKNLKFS